MNLFRDVSLNSNFTGPIVSGLEQDYRLERLMLDAVEGTYYALVKKEGSHDRSKITNRPIIYIGKSDRLTPILDVELSSLRDGGTRVINYDDDNHRAELTVPTTGDEAHLEFKGLSKKLKIII